MTPLRRASRFAFEVLLVALAILALAPRARADEAEARQLFKQGVELYDKKQYQAALAAFEGAYREKPSPGIKQNIGLCHKALGDPVAAATAFDEALDEGRGTLKPETRAAIELELGALSKVVGTVQLRVVGAADRRPLDDVAVVTVDGAPRPRAAWRRPIRLTPGIHVFTAHVDGFADPPQKKLSILAGSPVDATFELGAPTGMILIRPNVAGASIKIDGFLKGQGPWQGEIAAGPHRVEVSAPDFETAIADIVVTAGADVEYAIRLHRHGELPPPYEGPPARRPRDGAEKPPPQWTIVPMLVGAGVSYALSPALFEASPTRRGFGGASGGVRGGYRITRLFAIEIYGEVGAVGANYRLENTNRDTETTMTQWHLLPMIRFATNGKVRFTSGTGVGVHGVSVETLAPGVTGPTTTSSVARIQKGKGTGATWMVDAGLQIDVGTLFLEAAAFFDLHGVGAIRGDEPNVQNQRFFLGSPAVRVGGRIGLGIPF
ncbi:MAG: PEGA domain-containing protein [Labilithrix sp.]|nr:PEGA domain-containing protein [Labilithrix sp.]